VDRFGGPGNRDLGPQQFRGGRSDGVDRLDDSKLLFSFEHCREPPVRDDRQIASPEVSLVHLEVSESTSLRVQWGYGQRDKVHLGDLERK
jgi:hypothetical protein